MKRLVLLSLLALGGCTSHWATLDPHANRAEADRACGNIHSSALYQQCMNMHGFFAAE